MSKLSAPVGKELYVTLRQKEDELEVWVNGEVMDKENNSVIILLAGEQEGLTQSAMVGNLEFQALSIANLLSSYPPELIKLIFEMMGANVIEKDIDDVDGEFPNTPFSGNS